MAKANYNFAFSAIKLSPIKNPECMRPSGVKTNKTFIFEKEVQQGTTVRVCFLHYLTENLKVVFVL